MKVNNKGFTLIELLAVMIILITISLVAVSSITESLIRRDIKECEEQQELAVGVAKIYFAMENKNEVEISDLRNKGYLKSDDKIDRLNNDDKIKISGEKYLYNDHDVGESCS